MADERRFALGVCYYPEQWPPEQWDSDLREMRRLGLTYVRVGEFAWSFIEPEAGRFTWEGLDRVLDLVTQYGLKAILGTPTAAPPRWLVERHPDILPVGLDGHVREFGSRRHYCFSSPPYGEAATRIVRQLVDRYGRHDSVVGWQLDNEYGCHDTVLCRCARCRDAFQAWLASRYITVDRLNEAWGTAFWCQTYGRFEQVGLPVGTVTEANPAHRLDYRRFASDQVRAFNRAQADIVREGSPDRFVTTNFMGFFTEFDHAEVAADLDVVSWDSYPLGTTEMSWLPDSVKTRYARTGHPDVAAFHHDLYRALGRGRMWVMEQQPGPVNWAPYNPSPAAGMVRLWTWEAFAHGAEAVSYFRWRQAPFGQEQKHAGLYRVDGIADAGAREVQAVSLEMARPAPEAPQPVEVALVFDYESAWMCDIQPQGRDFRYLELVFSWYQALRLLGLDVDVVPRTADFSGYRLVAVPTLVALDAQDVTRLRACPGTVVLGPRSGSRLSAFQLPPQLPPGPLQDVLPARVVRVESLRPGLPDTVRWNGAAYPVERWKEWLETMLVGEAEFEDGRPALLRSENVCYLAFWPSVAFLVDWFDTECQKLGLETIRVPSDLRLRRRDGIQFAFNYGESPVQIPGQASREFVLGGSEVPAYGLSAWRTRKAAEGVLASVKAGLLGE